MMPTVAPVKALCIDPSCLVEKAAGSVMKEMVKSFGEAAVNILKFLSTFWMQVPSPTVAQSGGSDHWGQERWQTVSTLAQMQGWLGPFTAVIAVASFSVAVGRIGMSARGEDVHKVVRQVAAVGAGTLIVTAGTQLLIQAGDEFSPWIIQQASHGRDPSQGLQTLITTGFGSGNPTQNIGLWLIVFLLAIFGGIAQCVFMIIRGAALMVLMVFVAPVAAGSASDDGWARFKRLGMIILGFALYKPVAAIIYATGIMLMTSPSGTPQAGGGDIKGALYGLAIMILAALALPAFIKFLLPIAATGSSSMFSGAAVAGVAAAGAAIVAMGGAGAAGGGAGGASGAGAGGGGTRGPAAPSSGSPGAESASPPGSDGGGTPGANGADGASGTPPATPGPQGTSESSSDGQGGRQFAEAVVGGARDASSRMGSAEVEDVG